jgi:predicted ABC-type ATPase
MAPGKAALTKDASIEDSLRSVWIINPDLLTVRIRDVEGLSLTEANLHAVQRIEAWLEASIRAHQTVGVETVLSTDKYRRLVIEAKARQFEVRLIYVILKSPDLSIERVRLRVAKGGHDVPPDKIRERYGRSLKQLPWFLAQADKALVFDNSEDAPNATPRLIAEKKANRIEIDPDALPQIVDAVQTAAADDSDRGS